MAEREIADGLPFSRSDTNIRSHKNYKIKDKYIGSNYGGRKGRGEAPPTITTPSRHQPHTSRLQHGSRGSRERRRVARGRAGEEQKSQLEWEGGGAGDGERKGRKTTLNHLLNFTISPRDTPGGRDGRGGGGGGGGRRRMFRTISHNKEQFLQANCQFVVNDKGDYTVHATDSDLLVDWDSVELVRLFCHEIPSCPICLYPPRAAKITRCGHVYCWSCVLHYLSLGEKKWRKCPICYESIYKKDLKSVMAMSTPQRSPGDVVTMRLMVRDKHSTLVRPSTSPTTSSLLPLSSEGERFVKLLVVSERESLEKIVGPEREALRAQLSSLDSGEQSELCFIEQALQELKEREMTLLQSQDVKEKKETVADDQVVPVIELVDQTGNEVTPAEKMTPLSEGGDHIPPGLSDDEEEERPETVYSSSSSTSTTSSSFSAIDEPSPLVRTSSRETSPGVSRSVNDQMSPTPPVNERDILSPSSSTPPDTNSHVYFYQSDDGQHLYLHTVNARCLVKEYGGLENAPVTIKARIVEMEQLTMTEETRSRYKYLSHLPITCQFALCELDLRPPLLSKDTLTFYKGELERRRNKRTKKRREEKRKEKAMAAATQPSPLTSDAFPLPTSTNHPLSPEKIHDLLPQLTSSPPLISHISHHHHQTQPLPQLEETETDTEVAGDCNHPSFAEALRGGQPPVWPIKTSSPPQQHSSSSSTAIISGSSPSGDDGGGEGEKVPTFQEAFTEALLTAQVATVESQSSKKTAKKGRKKLVLFSTGGTRGV